jgi:hypothetical protein
MEIIILVILVMALIGVIILLCELDARKFYKEIDYSIEQDKLFQRCKLVYRKEHNKNLPASLNLPLSVLCYEDDGLYVAHCLEMDILDYGETPQVVMEELQTLINAQVEFCKDKKINMFFYAPDKFFKCYKQIHKLGDKL